jgi:hypothetical protein
MSKTKLSKKLVKQMESSPMGAAILALLLKAQNVKSISEAKDLLSEAENVGKQIGEGIKKKNETKNISQQKSSSPNNKKGGYEAP